MQSLEEAQVSVGKDGRKDISCIQTCTILSWNSQRACNWKFNISQVACVVLRLNVDSLTLSKYLLSYDHLKLIKMFNHLFLTVQF